MPVSRRRPPSRLVLAAASLTGAALLTLAASTGSASEACYEDEHGVRICFPLGDLSFADEVVSFAMGDPPPAAAADRDASHLLGPPSRTPGKSGSSVTLGCGGSVTVRFTDNAIVDVAGADLHLFEIGPSEEPTRLEISKDGESWVTVGRVWGGRAEVDIGWATEPGASFRYARITDLRYDCGSARWPGADIDAVGAIGSASRLSLDSSVLFDVDRDVLRPEAAAEIRRVVESIRRLDATRVGIEGHTDADGSDAHNLDLSRRRAASVRAALDEAGALDPEVAVEVVGYGESRPVAPNETAAGKQRNRRVEIVVVPAAEPGVVHGSDEILALTRPGVHGEWTYDGDRMTIPEPVDGRVRATYTRDEGRILGRVQGHTIEGIWVEKDSNVACARERDASLHWGRVRMEFDPDFVRYTAKWSYCDEEEWRGEFSGRWTG